jgi:ornithine carbamoyltransferase
MDKARQLAALSGGSISETNQPAEALKGATIIYAKEWGTTESYGSQEAYQQKLSALSDWQLSPQRVSLADPTARVMHCLPVRRNVAIDEAVLDGPHSIVIPQAHNRLWAQMAVLHRLMGKSFI